MNQQPFTIQTIQNGILEGQHSMPIKDSTSDGTSTFEMGRRIYLKSKPAESTVTNESLQKKWLGNRDSSGVTESRRNRAIGKGSTLTTPISFTSGNRVSNTVIDALSRVRGGGAVAPAKKGANQKNGLTPSFAPIPQKSIYGNKYPVLFH